MKDSAFLLSIFTFEPIGACCYVDEYGHPRCIDDRERSRCNELSQLYSSNWQGDYTTCCERVCDGVLFHDCPLPLTATDAIAGASPEPSIAIIQSDKFDNAELWAATGAFLATGSDPADPNNKVVIMQENNEASFFRTLRWPAHGYAMGFDYMFREPRGDENLTVYVENRIVYYDHAATSLATGQLSSSGAIYVGDIAGTSARLTFVLRTDGVTGGSVVLDNLEIFGFVPGDYDANTTIDLADLAAFQRCFRESPLTPECSVFDLREDQVVDLRDFVILAACMSGPDEPGDPQCAALPGACCFGNGACLEIGNLECAAKGGNFVGEGAQCDGNQCGGACCFGVRCSFRQSAFSCAESLGVYQGDGTSCDDLTIDCPPVRGACCFGPDYCSEDFSQECSDYGGVFLGTGTHCDDTCCNPPSSNGACCFGDGGCESGCRASCEASDGVFHGEGSQCVGALCTGACCNDYGGYCDNYGPALCSKRGGTFHGLGTDCASTECRGACCDVGGEDNCAATGPGECASIGGTFHGLGTDCAETQCTGACCGDYSCERLGPTRCGELGGTFFGLGSQCSDALCPTGSCCESDGCSSGRTEASCARIGGRFLGVGAGCYQNDEWQCSGACCFEDGTCEEVSDDQDCASQGGLFTALGVGCWTAGCGGACCLSPDTCRSEQNASSCAKLGGTFQGGRTTCADDGLACSDETGACCPGPNSADGCRNDLTESDCAWDEYRGDGTRCTDVDCNQACPGPGDCCEAHRTAGCADPDCCDVVCQIDPQCCVFGIEGEWDDLCVQEAARLCGDQPGTYCLVCPGEGSCCNDHRTPGCDDESCCETVCARDPYCCEMSWDSLCVGLVANLCATPCP